MRHLIDQSGVPPNTRPVRIDCGIPPGITVVCPRWRVISADTELSLRRTAAGLVVGWILDHQEPALYLPYIVAVGEEGSWESAFRVWRETPLVCFAAWHFRGVQERLAVMLDEALVQRVERGMPTIVTCSADPTLLSARWHADETVLEMLRKPKMWVRVGESGKTTAGSN